MSNPSLRSLQESHSSETTSDVKEIKAYLHIVIIGGKDIRNLPFQNGPASSYVFVAFSDQTYLTKTRHMTAEPEWGEAHEFSWRNLSNCMLHLKLIHVTKALLGEAHVNVLLLDLAESHRLKVQLPSRAGCLHVQLTVCCFDALMRAEILTLQTHYRPTNEGSWKKLFERTFPQNITKLESHYPILGEFKIKVIQAKNLPKKDAFSASDPYCVVECGNTRLRTHCVRSSNCPVWQVEFTIPIYDIYSYTSVMVFDEDTLEDEFVGRICIPLLKVKNGKNRWYALKDMSYAFTNEGLIELQMSFHYNLLKAFIRVFEPKEERFFKPPPVFKILYLKKTILRCIKLADTVNVHKAVFMEILNWKQPLVSLFTLIALSFGLLYIEGYMVPLLIILYLFYNYIVIAFSDHCVDYVDEDEDEEKEPNPGQLPVGYAAEFEAGFFQLHSQAPLRGANL